MLRIDRIKEFLSTFATQEKDLIDGIADIDLQDDDDAPARTKNLKYMQQLVRELYIARCALAHPSHSKE